MIVTGFDDRSCGAFWTYNSLELYFQPPGLSSLSVVSYTHRLAGSEDHLLRNGPILFRVVPMFTQFGCCSLHVYSGL